MSEAFRPGFGGELRAAREHKKLATADVAAKLKLTVRQVEAIEAEDFTRLPDPVFARGFVRNYARLVGVDADNLITPVDVEHAVTESITAPSAGVSIATRGLRRWLLFPLFGLAAFLLLVALLYYWLRQGEDALVTSPVDGASSSVLEVPALPATPAPETPALPATDTDPVESEPVASTPPAIAPTPATPSPPAAPLTPPTAPLSPPAAAPTPSPAATLATVPAARHTLRFETELDAWIQVVDSKGNRFSKLIQAGGVESFAGEPPFRLVVGEAARVKLTYNGHSIDLRPFIGQKVARLTLE